jgi:hypothetical protein
MEKEEMKDVIKMDLKEICCARIVHRDGVFRISGVERSESVSKDSLT